MLRPIFRIVQGLVVVAAPLIFALPQIGEAESAPPLQTSSDQSLVERAPARPRPRPRPRPRRRPTPRPTPRRRAAPRPTARPTPRPTTQPTPVPTGTPVPTPIPTPVPTPVPTPIPPTGGTPVAGNNTSLNGYRFFSASDPWNLDVSEAPLDSASTAVVNFLGAGTGLHPDFGTVYNGAPNGIQYSVVAPDVAWVPINFTDYGSESDPGPYPIPANAAIEAGSDHHLLVLNPFTNRLYELFGASRRSDGGYDAASGAVFNVGSDSMQYAQRPLCWTSADAAGLAILPGLVRYDEVQAGEITHALRFTVSRSSQRFVPPASHFASSSFDSVRPPMGARFRLKASFVVDRPEFSPEVRVILRALKKYGMIVADNGSDWFLSGAPNPAWNDDALHALQSLVHGGDFEMIQRDLFGPGITGWGNCP